MRSALVPVCIGLIFGIGLALAVSGAMRSMMFGFDPRDPVTFIAVPLLLLAAAVGAVWIPARRATALDPLVSLRYE
jgi:ABC-type antimicrobial peptide transport system permease subunit